MLEFFPSGRGNKEMANHKNDFHNFYDPFQREPSLNNIRQRNFCGCGLAATGDELPVLQDEPTETVKDKVMSLQSWQYIRMGFAIIGAVVVLKFIYTKLITK